CVAAGIRRLFAAFFVPPADVRAAFDLVGAHALGLGLHANLLDGFPRVAGVAFAQTPLADDLVRLARLGNRVLEVAVALLGGVGTNGADPTLRPLVLQQVTLDLPRHLAPG